MNMKLIPWIFTTLFALIVGLPATAQHKAEEESAPKAQASPVEPDSKAPEAEESEEKSGPVPEPESEEAAPDSEANDVVDHEALEALLADSKLTRWRTRTPRVSEDLARIQNHFTQVLPHVRKAVVGLVTPSGAGSGVIVTPDGLVLTAGHVSVDPGKKITVILESGKKVSGLTLGRSDFADAGMVQIMEESDYPFAMSAEKSLLGEWCFTVAHPGGYSDDRGSVVRLGRIISRRTNTIQSDCKLLGGDSGGPLFNMRGEVIGINSRISGHLEGNYHAPIEAFVRHWERMQSKEVIKPRSGFLGVAVAENKEGVEVTYIFDDSAASRIDLAEGDIITEINGERIVDKPHFRQVLGMLEVGDEVELKYQRDGEQKEIKVKLGDRPDKN